LSRQKKKLRSDKEMQSNAKELEWFAQSTRELGTPTSKQITLEQKAAHKKPVSE